jgi:AraC-like DNA-binding protein
VTGVRQILREQGRIDVLVNNAGEKLHLSQSGDETTIEPEWLFATAAPPVALVDATFASIVELGRRGTGVHSRPVRLALRCRSDAADARSSYFGASVAFGAPRDTLVPSAADLDLPFTTHNAELADILAPELGRHLAQLHAAASTAHQVKRVVKRRLSGSPVTVGSVAKDLGTSLRTLQRRITAEGTTFRRILDEARQELVRQYLADPEIRISETAFLLGYQDANSFYRAFRTWEGTTPAHWRDGRGTPH